MSFEDEIYDIEFTEDCVDDIREIYKYISKSLYADKSAKELMRKMKNKVLNLAEAPRIGVEVEKADRMKRTFRRLVIENYIILYTIDDSKKIIYISHMFYGKRKYM